MFIEREYLLKDSFNITEDSILINPDMANLLFTSEIKEFLNNRITSYNVCYTKLLRGPGVKLSITNPEISIAPPDVGEHSVESQQELFRPGDTAEFQHI